MWELYKSGLHSSSWSYCGSSVRCQSLEDPKRVRFDPLLHSRYPNGTQLLCVLLIGALMSAIIFTVILVSMMLVSFGILVHYSKKRNWKGFDRAAVAIAFIVFLYMAGNTVTIGAYGYNTIRNNGENNAGLSLSRN